MVLGTLVVGGFVAKNVLELAPYLIDFVKSRVPATRLAKWDGKVTFVQADVVTAAGGNQGCNPTDLVRFESTYNEYISIRDKLVELQKEKATGPKTLFENLWDQHQTAGALARAGRSVQEVGTTTSSGVMSRQLRCIESRHTQGKRCDTCFPLPQGAAPEDLNTRLPYIGIPIARVTTDMVIGNPWADGLFMSG